MPQNNTYAHRKDYAKKWALARRRQNIADGICVHCHREFATMSQLCNKCRKRKNEQDRAYNEARRKGFRNTALCLRCGAPLDSDGDDGVLTCINCRKKAMSINWGRV